MRLSYFLNADERKKCKVLDLINLWSSIIKYTIEGIEIQTIDWALEISSNYGIEIPPRCASLIRPIVSILEEKIYEAPARENRLHLLTCIAGRVKYQNMCFISEQLHPECKCDWHPLFNDNMSKDESRNEYLRARQARNKCIDMLMLKYNIPSQFRPVMVRSGRTGSNYLTWDRTEEIEKRILLECPDTDKDLLHQYISVTSCGALFITDFFTRMETIYDIKIPDIVEETQEMNNQAQNNAVISSYKTMPSTHRRAAVMALIEKSGLCKRIDRTKKAAFVEAVTGGNINANPKDTVSYRKPEQRAIDAASELLKTIGIE